MDIGIADKTRAEIISKPFSQRLESKEFLKMDEAIADLEGFYVNFIVMEYGMCRECINKCKNTLDKAFESSNSTLESEDSLRMRSEAMDSRMFMRRFRYLENALRSNKRLIKNKNNEIEMAWNNINGLVVKFANEVYSSYSKVVPEEKDDMVLDVVNRLSLSEEIQDGMRREFTESILDEIALRMEKNKNLCKKIKDTREQNMRYIRSTLRHD